MLSPCGLLSAALSASWSGRLPSPGVPAPRPGRLSSPRVSASWSGALSSRLPAAGPLSVPLHERLCAHPLGVGRHLPGRTAGDLSGVPVCGQRGRRGRHAGGLAGFHPVVHPAAGGSHRPCWPCRPHGTDGSGRDDGNDRPDRCSGSHGPHGNQTRWTTSGANPLGSLGKMGWIWCAFDAEHPVQ